MIRGDNCQCDWSVSTYKSEVPENRKEEDYYGKEIPGCFNCKGRNPETCLQLKRHSQRDWSDEF